MSQIQVDNSLRWVTPDMAAKWLEANLYSKQRPVREWHVKELAHEMSEGRFTPGTPIAFAVHEEKDHLINGQHTLWAIVESDMPIQLTVQKYAVASDLEIASLFSRFDRHVVRSYNDSIVAHELDVRLGISKTNLNRLSSAIVLLATGLEDGGKRYTTAPQLRSFDERLALIENYVSEARTYFDEMIVGVPREHHTYFLRSAVIAIALVTLRYQPDKAKIFWRSTALDDGLRKGQPQKALLRWLQSNTPSNSSHDCRTIGVAWNAFFEARELQFLRMPAVGTFKIAGTPIEQRLRPKSRDKALPKDDASQMASLEV